MTEHTTTRDWEKEFDDLFLGNEALDLLKPTNASKVKAFIRTLLTEHEQTVRAEMTPDYSNVTRVEVINHASGEGRAYVYWEKYPLAIELSLQDAGQTLKIFLSQEGTNPKSV